MLRSIPTPSNPPETPVLLFNLPSRALTLLPLLLLKPSCGPSRDSRSFLFFFFSVAADFQAHAPQAI